MEAKDLIKLGFEKSELTDKDIVDGSEYKVVDWRVKITDGLFIKLEQETHSSRRVGVRNATATL